MKNNESIKKYEIENSNDLVESNTNKGEDNNENSLFKKKFLKDTSYQLFNTIFNNIEMINIKGEKIIIKDYEEFKKFQIEVNSYYISKIKRFEYNKKNKFSIIKENPYKPIRLRKIWEEDSKITISPNGIFASTTLIENDSESSLSHYNNIIGNAIIVEGVYCFEVKILELGDDTDLYFGIISSNSNFFKNNKYKNFPINEFTDGYAINLNEYYELENANNKKIIKEGDVILVKIDLCDYFIEFYINGENIKNDGGKIEIDENEGYYPAFSLSSEKEIQVNFGGTYDFLYVPNNGNKLNKKPISSYNNLKKIVSCYMEIIENNLIKIINHPQIAYNESINYFYPMLNLLGNIAFNDEYIMKNYILKFMYQKYDHKQNIYQFFNTKYNLIYLIIQTTELNKQKEGIIFLLDCLSEEIRHNSYEKIGNKCDFNNWCILIKLYNYFMQRKLFYKILFQDKEEDDINKRIKNQLYIIFKAIKIYDIHLETSYLKNLSKERMFEKINNFIINEYNQIINQKIILEPFEELINTLIYPILEYPECNTNEIDKLIENNNRNGNFCLDNNDIDEEIINDNDNINNYEILKKYLNNFFSSKKSSDPENNWDKKNKEYFCLKRRKIKKCSYREIFVDLIEDIIYSKSERDVYNLVITIFFPLIEIYNDNYQKESSSNLINQQLLSFLPLIDGIRINLKDSKELIITNDALNKNDNLLKIINPELLQFELYNKKYSISSYILKILVNIFYSIYWNKDNIESYYNLKKCQNNAYAKYLNDKENENIYLNCYYSKYQKFLLLLNNEHYKIIEKAVNSLNPYFSELINNNFYLFFPFYILFGIEFFVEYFFYHCFLYKNFEFLNDKKDLINLFINFNFKLLNNENINEKKIILLVVMSIEKLFSLFEHLISLEKQVKNYEKLKENLNRKNINDFFNETHFKILLNSIKNNYNENVPLLISIFDWFFINNSSKYTYNEYQYFITNVSNNLAKDDFLFKVIIIDSCIKRNIIKNISKILYFNQNEKLNEDEIYILKKIFNSIFLSLCCVKNYICEEKLMNKYFNNSINEPDLIIEEAKRVKEKNNKITTNQIYYYIIEMISIIIKKLFKEKYFQLLIVSNSSLNYFDDLKFSMENIIRKSISLLEVIIIKLPQNYYNKLIENENEISKKTKGQNFNNLSELNYFKIIFENIKKRNVSRLIILLKNYDKIFNFDVDKMENILKEIMSFLDNIEKKYNLKEGYDTDEESENEILCPICLENFSDSHVSPCGHMFCWSCIQKFKNNICPLCRINLEGVLEYPEFQFNIDIE